MSPLELQRLVDGQVSHAQRAQWLQDLAPQDPQWRTLSLLLLEDQALAKEISGSPMTKILAPVPVASTDAPSDKSNRLSNRLSKSNSKDWKHLWSTLLACSALFIIGLYSGYLGRYLTTNPNPVSTQPVTNSIAESNQSLKSLPYDSPLRVRVESPSGMPIEIPLVDAREIDPQWIIANNSLEIAKLNQQLKRRGYEMDAKPKIYSGALQDGRRFVVPVHDVSLKPFGL
jgi:hypothetical protein